MKTNSYIVYALLLATCVLFRLVPIAPNFEPILAFAMPLAFAFGGFAGAAFAFIAIAAKDSIDSKVGLWTIYTAITYAGIAIASSKFFTAKKPSITKYALFSVAGVIVYDAITAALFGMQFNQTLEMTLIGQIPFTIYHIAGALFYAITITPVLHYFVLPAVFREEKNANRIKHAN